MAIAVSTCLRSGASFCAEVGLKMREDESDEGCIRLDPAKTIFGAFLGLAIVALIFLAVGMFHHSKNAPAQGC
jgi:hypothetical protein